VTITIESSTNGATELSRMNFSGYVDAHYCVMFSSRDVGLGLGLGLGLDLVPGWLVVIARICTTVDCHRRHAAVSQ